MKVSEDDRKCDPFYSSFFLTQSARNLLRRKYADSFCFFKTKHLNKIIYNQTQDPDTIQFKDIAILTEDTEFLKKYYHHYNHKAKPEIKDRMTLLKKFYAKANLLTYQYPTMIITNMHHLFKKRHQKIIKIGIQEQSETQQKSESEVVFLKKFNKEDQYLINLDWSDILSKKFEEEHSIDEPVHSKTDLSFEEQEYSIYDSEFEVKRKYFLQKIGIVPKETDNTIDLTCTSQTDVANLIVDFDEIDKQFIVQQYQKLIDKENICVSSQSSYQRPQFASVNSLTVFKKPLSSSLTINDSPLSNALLKKSSSQIAKQSMMMIGSRQQRYQEIKLMKQSKEYEKVNSFVFPQEPIAEREGQDSPFMMIKNQEDISFHMNHKRQKQICQSQLVSTNMTQKQKQSTVKKSSIIQRHQYVNNLEKQFEHKFQQYFLQNKDKNKQESETPKNTKLRKFETQKVQKAQQPQEDSKPRRSLCRAKSLKMFKEINDDLTRANMA